MSLKKDNILKKSGEVLRAYRRLPIVRGWFYFRFWLACKLIPGLRVVLDKISELDGFSKD